MDRGITPNFGFGVVPDPGLYDELWSYIRQLNGGNIFLNRNGEGLSSKYPDVAAVLSYCRQGGVYVDYCGWPMYYDGHNGSPSRNRFKDFLRGAGADPNYLASFVPWEFLPCFQTWPYRYGWATDINARIGHPDEGGRLAASYVAPSDVCTGPGGLKRYAYSAVGARVYLNNQFRGWYFYGVGDGAKSVSPQVYADFIRYCVTHYPPSPPSSPPPPPQPCDPDKCTSEPTLRRGDKGNCVGWVQRRLAQLGYSPGPVDCVFGTQTETAVRQFQADKGLAVDGVVGPQTWAALKGTSPPTPPPVPPIPPPTPEKDWLLYLALGGAAAGVALGIYFLVRR